MRGGSASLIFHVFHLPMMLLNCWLGVGFTHFPDQIDLNLIGLTDLSHILDLD